MTQHPIGCVHKLARLWPSLGLSSTMDLTSLSSNLPRNPSSEDQHEPEADLTPTPDLMMAFRQAALSVTTLYKAAASEVERARRTGRGEGYSDCLDDVLQLLIKIESRADKKTLEIFKQWALSKRRKLGERPRRKREDREASSESERRSSSPIHHQPLPQSTSSPSARRSPPKSTTAQVPVISYTANQSRHVPPPLDTVDVELPDHDIDSPPTSPRRPTQYGPTNVFQFQANAHPVTSAKAHGKRGRERAGAKRGFDSLNMNDFFDLAGIEKLHNAKRHRYQ